MRAVGVIPARGGSKGVPGKNLRLLGGEPLLVHTIRAAQAAARLDAVVVTSDDSEILELALAHQTLAVRRPAELARDESPTEDALIHALESLGERPTWVVTLEPTSPLRTAATIDHCVELAEEKQAGSVLTVVEDRTCWGRLDGEGRFTHTTPGAPRRRQERAALYGESSTVYVTSAARLLEGRSVLTEPVYAVVIGAQEAIDINTELDFTIAEALLRAGGA